jgi:hypothetical protein
MTSRRPAGISQQMNPCISHSAVTKLPPPVDMWLQGSAATGP